MRIRGAEDFISSEFGSNQLTDDISVRKSDYQAVLWGIVLVLGLGDEALASVVVGLSLPTALVLGLEPTESCQICD